MRLRDRQQAKGKGGKGAGFFSIEQGAWGIEKRVCSHCPRRGQRLVVKDNVRCELFSGHPVAMKNLASLPENCTNQI